MGRAKTVAMWIGAFVILWVIASAFTYLAPHGAGNNGTMDQNECGMGGQKYDC